MPQTYIVDRVSVEGFALQELLTAQAAKKYLLDSIVFVPLPREFVVVTKFDEKHEPPEAEGRERQGTINVHSFRPNP